MKKMAEKTEKRIIEEKLKKEKEEEM